jgi:hypothetical protein
MLISATKTRACFPRQRKLATCTSKICDAITIAIVARIPGDREKLRSKHASMRDPDRPRNPVLADMSVVELFNAVRATCSPDDEDVSRNFAS